MNKYDTVNYNFYSSVLKIQLYGLTPPPANLALIPQQHVIHQASKATIREVVIWSHFIKISKNVSCDYDGWVVETQLRKLRDT